MPGSETGGDLSGMLASLMENPEIRSLITSLSPASAAAGDGEAPNETTPALPAETGASGAGEEAAKLPAIPPELLLKLPALLSALSGGAHSPEQKPASGGEGDAKESAATPGEDVHRTALLQALRPYLNSKRRAVVDGMLQLGDLAKLFSTGERR